jgi:hypothetical protein
LSVCNQLASISSALAAEAVGRLTTGRKSEHTMNSGALSEFSSNSKISMYDEVKTDEICVSFTEP